MVPTSQDASAKHYHKSRIARKQISRRTMPIQARRESKTAGRSPTGPIYPADLKGVSYVSDAPPSSQLFFIAPKSLDFSAMKLDKLAMEW